MNLADDHLRSKCRPATRPQHSQGSANASSHESGNARPAMPPHPLSVFKQIAAVCRPDVRF